MNKMRFIFILLPFYIFSQQGKKPDTVFCDCITARQVTLKGTVKIGPTIMPLGSGNVNEISEQKQATRFAFEKEHNSAWYQLNIVSDGFLLFDIIPTKAQDDYDFMLFKGSAKGFCDSLQKYKIRPWRACISRNKEEISGVTGLNFNANQNLIKEGLGDAYVNPVEVKSGEVYYLVLDNVYANGDGHSINFHFEEMLNIQGVTQNEDQTPIKSEITITSQNGDTVKSLSTGTNGSFNFKVPLKRNVKYSLNFYNDSCFFASKEITTKTNPDSLKNIKTVLPTLKKGKKYIIQNINFNPGLTSMLPSALPSVANLHMLMVKNKHLKILITGHMNGCDLMNETDSKQFTVNRALTVKSYLTDRLIEGGRISTDGKGCTEMIYYLTKDTPEWQQVLNRRVEVFVLEK